ncbi:MAG: hypothetical protein AAF340_16375 [Pseudomonadota bacterium]
MALLGKNEWMTPERALAFSALGRGLSQLSAGQPVDLSSSHTALVRRQEASEQQRKLKESGILEQFSKEERAVLAGMPPGAAMQAVMQRMNQQPKLYEVGNRLVSGTGEVVYSGPENAPKLNATEQKIARLGELGIPRQEAITMLDSRDVSRDPITGELMLVDLRTGLPVQMPTPDVPPSETNEGSPSLATETAQPNLQFSLPGLPNSFGAEGLFKGALNKGADILGADVPFPEVEKAQSDIAVFREETLSAIAAAYDRQPPSWLLKLMRELTPEAGNLLKGASGAQSKLTALRDNFTREKASLERQLNRRRLSPARRQQIENRQVAIERAIFETNQFLQSFGSTEQKATSSGVKWRVIE